MFNIGCLAMETSGASLDLQIVSLPPFQMQGGNAIAVSVSVLSIDGGIEELDLLLDCSMDSTNWVQKGLLNIDYSRQFSSGSFANVGSPWARFRVLLQNRDGLDLPVKITLSIDARQATL